MNLRVSMLALGLVLTPALAATPALAQSAAEIAEPAHKTAADRLANIVAPDSDVPILVDGVLKSLISGMVKAEPEMVEFDAAFPGLFDAMKTAWRPVLLKAAYQSRPLYRADLSQLYQNNLTTAEMNEAADFLSQPDVQRFFVAAKSKVDFSATVADALAERDVSTESVRSDVGRAGTAAAADLSLEMEQKLTAFFGSPVGRRLVALNQKKAALDAKWVNYSPPGAEQEIEQATLEAMLTHIAKTDPKLAAAMRKKLESDGDLKKQKR
ncbi:MAG: hypothetical protein ABL912_09685 [Novosphingobium sp.]